MAWAKLDDGFAWNHKVAEISNDAALLYVIGLVYCARNLTDGELTATATRRLCQMRDIDQPAVDELVQVGLWETSDTGYRIHDYLDYNPSRDRVLGERADNAKRQEQWRTKHQPSTSNVVSNAVSNDQNNALLTPSRTRPVPVPHDLDPVDQTKEEPPPQPAVVSCPPVAASTKSSPRAPSYTPEFEQFWATWPRKEGKAEAYAAWRTRLREGLTSGTLQAAGQHYATYHAAKATATEFLLHASTFLGPNRRWEDFATGPPPTNGHPTSRRAVDTLPPDGVYVVSEESRAKLKAWREERHAAIGADSGGANGAGLAGDPARGP